MEEWPPGFRFYPTEEELVSFYLKAMVDGTRDGINRSIHRVIPVVDIYDHNPWDLPRFSENLCHKDPEQWFFFVPRRENEARGGRPSRLTDVGYWKATGSPGYVYSSSTNLPIGGKRTMVFYRGRAPHGSKTEWRMNEYTVHEARDHPNQALSAASSSSTAATAPQSMTKQGYSLCRVYKKSARVRSFDRRPPPPPPPPLSADQYQPLIQPSHGTEQTGGMLNQNPDQTVENTSLAPRDHSSSSPSSGDHGNTTMSIDDILRSWDKQQFDLFFGDEI